MLKQKLGKLLAAKRKGLNMSQDMLAEKIGVHVRTLGKIENGHSFVSAETLFKLCKYFKLPPKSFFDIDEISVNEKKIRHIIEKLREGGDEKIDFYCKVINLIDTKYGK